MKNISTGYQDFLKSLESSGQLYVIAKEFSALKTNYDRVDYISKLKWFKQVKFAQRTCVKSSLDSQNWLNKAQASFHERTDNSKCTLALSYCNRSLMSAPVPSDKTLMSSEFLTALRLRADILCSLSMYTSALADVELILSSQISKTKLRSVTCCSALEMKAQLCVNLDRFDDAITAYNELVRIYQERGDSVTAARFRRIAANLKKKKCKASVQSRRTSEPNLAGKQSSLAVERDHSQELGCFHNCVFPRWDGLPDSVMKEDILPGEIVMVENPTACVLFLDHVTDLCYGCFKRSERLPSVTCPNCAMVLYCSETCRLKSRRFHEVECPILEYLVDDQGVSDVHLLLALRLIITSGCQDNFNPTSKSNGESFEVSNNPRLAVSQCFNAGSLPHGCELWAFDLFTDTFYSVLIIKLFHLKTSFFDYCSHPVAPENKTFSFNAFSTTLLCSLQNMAYHAIPIMEKIHKRAFQQPNYSSPYACGIYATMAFLEHSCHPNSAIRFQGTTAVLMAVRTIPKDGGITINRIGTDRIMNRNTSRKEFLQHYNNECRCMACIQDWSSLGKRYHVSSLLRHDKDSIGFLMKEKCYASYFLSRLKDMEGFIDNMSSNDAFKCSQPEQIEEFIELVCRYLKVPFLFTIQAEHLYKKGLQLMGNHNFIAVADRPEVLSSKLFAQRRLVGRKIDI